ncbi:MAG: hypothetical protein R3F05_14070 [Planctomycetota bacterium]
MDLTADRPTLEQIEAMARAQREAREQAQARALEAQRTRQRAEDDVRRALLVEYHLYRAAALAQKQAKPDRFEEAYLQWQTGARTDAADIDALMFDTEKVLQLVRFLHRQDLLPREGFDAAALRLEFPNWVDDLALVPTDGSIRAALKSLAVRRTGIVEDADVFRYDPEQDSEPKFRRKTRPEEV